MWKQLTSELNSKQIIIRALYLVAMGTYVVTLTYWLITLSVRRVNGIGMEAKYK